jgi:hypothetical protein
MIRSAPSARIAPPEQIKRKINKRNIGKEDSKSNERDKHLSRSNQAIPQI